MAVTPETSVVAVALPVWFPHLLLHHLLHAHRSTGNVGFGVGDYAHQSYGVSVRASHLYQLPGDDLVADPIVVATLRVAPMLAGKRTCRGGYGIGPQVLRIGAEI